MAPKLLTDLFIKKHNTTLFVVALGVMTLLQELDLMAHYLVTSYQQHIFSTHVVSACSVERHCM